MYPQILPTLSILIIFPIFFIGSYTHNPLVNENSIIDHSENVIVIQPCSMNAEDYLSDHSVKDLDIEISSDCKGNYAHCGNDVWKCPRYDDALFACCHLSGTCPSDDEPIAN